MDDPDKKIILALETANGGGSVAVLKNGKLIDSAAGAGNLSKSEDILPIIESLLKKNGIEKKEIGLIAASDGPGSLTGLRIGLAIAKGLGDALSAEVYKISVLDALTYHAKSEGRIIAAFYTEKSGVFFREFFIKDGKRRATGEVVHAPKLIEFVDQLNASKEEDISFVLTGNLIAVLANYFEKDKILDRMIIFPAEGNLAETIGAAIASDNDRK